ncbi:hypothetical protein M441DRAFT_233002 [Trichoderma asperellum CBS 433.97]|uniref:Uncharacterized protein n=1 Tax=Trichoderma asperellum (strain ATCC 204424 / CBS 433.97 / NBRC 101777) TaxID=1042311 RepID=A0A2T3ZQW8_TRIA4|nr:hypothetical protein M441DRAFT_233002 [Trichoderma asperellum CBS 433.97]PTB47185.1 hypothetical protein M441DRAFT_233002 [Trichoderma asperellum CBS 433.97]
MRGLLSYYYPVCPYMCSSAHANKLIQLICIIHATCRPGLGDFSCDSRPVSPSPLFSFFVLPSTIMCFGPGLFLGAASGGRC